MSSVQNQRITSDLNSETLDKRKLEMRHLLHAFGLIIIVGTATPAFANNAAHHQAIAQIFAADRIATDCNGLSGIGSEDYQAFVYAATDLAAKEQGLRVNKLRRLLFYGTSESLVDISDRELQRREQDPQNATALCRFGRSVAGTKDAIGRFLVKD